MKAKERIEWIPAYSFALCIFVCCIHNPTKAYFQYGQNVIDNCIHYFLCNILPSITDIAVPSFFILSAYLFYRNYTYERTVYKYKSRLKSLVIPYLFWNFISLIIEMLTKIPAVAAFSVDTSNPFTIKNILLGIFLHKYNVFWFVFALILYNLFCFAFYFLLKRKKIGIVVIGTMLILYSLKVINIVLPGECYFQTDSLIYYSIGAYLGIHYKELLNTQFKKKDILISALVLFVFIILDLIIKPEALLLDFVLVFIRVLAFWVIGGGNCFPYYCKVVDANYIFYIFHSHNNTKSYCYSVANCLF